jgi:uncharacterized membrane protein YdjX (TVP38/TMEM64 family)
MLDAITQFIEQSGRWMYLLAPLFMIVVAILPVPAEIPAMLNGMIFGATVGASITWSGGLVGAILSFELARRFGRPLAERLVSSRALAKADRAVCSAGWPGLLTLRLIPTVAFTLVNWAAGCTPIRRWTFCWTTAVGIIPGAIVFTMTGTGLGAVYRRNPELGVALVALALTVIVWTVARYRAGAARGMPAECDPAPTTEA